jgi:hypothetical protein
LIALHIEEGFEGRALDLGFHEDFNCRIRHGALSPCDDSIMDDDCLVESRVLVP